MSYSDSTMQDREPRGGHREPADRDRPRPGNGPSTLSTAHIRPFVEYRAGASVLKSSRAIPGDQVGGGKRGRVQGFSKSSRRRLMLTIGQIERAAALPCFVTLTWPDEFPSPAVSKAQLKAFVKRLRRAFPGVGLIWKLEPQLRGAPHYHLLAWGVSESDLLEFIPGAWFEIAGGGDRWHLLWHQGKLGHGNKPCVEQVYSYQGVLSYASKYLGKTFEVAGWGDKWTGRFWGVIGPEHIPFGRQVVLEVPMRTAQSVIRYGRRFAHLKGRDYKSLTIFCDADQWVERLGMTGEIKQVH